MTREGTEPEGWYVDLPYAVFLVGANYSPLECRQRTRDLWLLSIYLSLSITPSARGRLRGE